MYNSQIFLKIEKKEIDRNNKVTKYGFYPEYFFEVDEKKYLIKKSNFHCYINNEIYLMSIIQNILGSENSPSAYFAIQNFENILNKPYNINPEWRIASMWIDGTKNLMETDIDLTKKPSNLVSSMLLSVILHNIDPNLSNILVDENNKFYLIDPLVISDNNLFKINTEKLYNNMDKLYKNFIKEANADNIKNKLSTLLTEYIKLCNDKFLYRVISVLKKRNLKNQILKTFCCHETEEYKKNKSTIDMLEKIYNKSCKLIQNNIIKKLICLMSDKKIKEEISIIKNYNEKKLYEISNYFESEKIFPDFGKSGIQPKYKDMILQRIDMLSEIELYK